MIEDKPLKRTGTVLVLVDLQERLLPAVCGADTVVANALRLAKSADLLQVPTIVTEQYPKGLGPTVAALREVVSGSPVREKLTFSACGDPGFIEALKALGRTDVVLAGIECHVCVLQTGLDLLRLGYRVLVCADATGSRTAENCHLGLERLRAAGAVVVSTEMVLFEWLERAGTPEFKQVQALLK